MGWCARSASAGSAIGCITNNGVTWRGFTIDDSSNPQFAADGVVNIQSADYCTFERLTIIGRHEPTLDGDQYCAIFWSDAGNIIIRNNRMYGFGGGSTGASVDDADENATAVTGYFRSENILIEQNEVYYNGAGFYLKGIRDGDNTPDWLTGRRRGRRRDNGKDGPLPYKERCFIAWCRAASSRRKALRNLASSSRRCSLGVEGLKGGTVVALPASSTATMVK